MAHSYEKDNWSHCGNFEVSPYYCKCHRVIGLTKSLTGEDEYPPSKEWCFLLRTIMSEFDNRFYKFSGPAGVGCACPKCGRMVCVGCKN